MDKLALMKEKQDELQPLFNRMDADFRLYTQSKYTMKDDYGNIVSDVHNVTLPYAAIFATRVINILSSANCQTEVEAEKLDDKILSIIEGFLDDMDYEVDTGLSNRGKMPISITDWERDCIRGRIVDLIRHRLDKGIFVADEQSVDPRYFLYETTDKGFEWAARILVKTKAQIKRGYGVEISGKNGTLKEYWGKDICEVYIDDKKEDEYENPYGSVPFIMSVVPAGSSLEDKDNIVFEGESVFFLNRNIYKELNRFGTIDATLTERSFYDHIQYESDRGEQGQPHEPPKFGEKVVYPVEPGRGYKAMPLNDTHNSARLWLGILRDLEQKGALSDMNYGTLTFPLSAVAITSLTESKDKILVPRLQAFAVAKKLRSLKRIEQIIQIGKPIELGEQGHKVKYNPKDLKGDYSIGYRFFSMSKEQMVADASISQKLGSLVSDDYKRREILKLQSPEEETRKVDIETAEKMDPILMLKKQAHALVDEERYLEARIVATQGVNLLKQRIAGQVNMFNPQPPQERKQQDELLRGLEGGGGGGARQGGGLTEEREAERISA